MEILLLPVMAALVRIEWTVIKNIITTNTKEEF